MGFRRLGRAPGFLALAVLTLALGIGAATTILSIARSLLVQPYPYADASGIYVFQIRNPASPQRGDRGWFRLAEILEYRAGVSAFEDVIAVSANEEVLYSGPEGTETLVGASVSGNTFAFLGVAPHLGRGLTPDDARLGAPAVFVLSYAAWSRLGRDSTLLGRSFVLDGSPSTLVGVMPPRFTFFDADLWRPASLDPLAPGAGSSTFQLLARLKPGMSLAQAEAQFHRVARRLAPTQPRLYPENFVVKGLTLTESRVGRLIVPLRIFSWAVVLLLLIACANVAIMLLSRGVARETEFGIRAALGAGPARLARELFLESLLLAVLGAVVGVALAYAGVRSFPAVIPRDLLPRGSTAAIDLPVLGLGLGSALITAVVFGLVPALHAAGADLTQAQGTTARTTTAGKRAGRLHGAIIVVALALSLTLLTAAGLLVRTFVNLQTVELGIEPEHVHFAQLRFPTGRYQSAAEKQFLLDQLLLRVRSIPGVISAAAASAVPFDGGVRTGIAVPGGVRDSAALALVQLCTDAYFETTGMRLRSGRVLSRADVAAARKVAVINEALARRYFVADDPLGRKIQLLAFESARAAAGDDGTFEVIGVVADAKNHGIENPSLPEAFVPASITGRFGRSLLVRTAGEAANLQHVLESELWAIDRNLALRRYGTLPDLLRQYSYGEPRFRLAVVLCFAIVGLVLVAIGVYSVIAFSVARRTRDIGVRVALGATRAHVLWAVLRRGVFLLGSGTMLGLLGSLAVSRLMSSVLWGVTPHDPLTLVAVTGVLIGVGLVACVLPARRALDLDPVEALRRE